MPFLSLTIATAVLALGGGAQPAGTGVAATPRPAPTFDGPVYATAYQGTTLYVGGDFSHAIVAGNRVARSRLAAIDTSTGHLLDWAPTADATVQAIAVDAGSVYVAGAFASVSGQPRDSLAVIDAATATVGALRHDIGGNPTSLAVGNGRLYLGGRLTTVDGGTVHNLAAFALSTGDRETGFRAVADGTVKALLDSGGRLYVGGLFHSVDGAAGSGKLAAVDPTNGARDTTFRPKVGVLVDAIAVGPAGVYAALGGQGGRGAAFTFAGTPLWTATTDGDVQAIAYLDGTVYLGGHFDHACASTRTGVHGVCVDGSASRVKLAAVDSSTGVLRPWNPRANGIHGVFALASSPAPHLLAAAGEFTTIGGAARAHLAVFGR